MNLKKVSTKSDNTLLGLGYTQITYIQGGFICPKKKRY